jgi:exodeoxyribonuclease-3
LQSSSGLWVYRAINYHLATNGLAATAKSASIYKGEKFSDHAPLTIAYDFKL